MSDTSRIDELRELLLSLQRTAAGEDRNTLATEIAALEDEMVENREHLTVLLNRGIIDESLYFQKLQTCFRVFLDRVSAKYGSEICQHVYGFENGNGFSDAREQLTAAESVAERPSSMPEPAAVLV